MASFGQPSSVVAEDNSLFVCDTGADAISLITSINVLHLATKQFGELYDAFGVHCDEKNVEAASVLPFVDNAMQFYRKCVNDIREFFELPHDKYFDGSFGALSKETIASLEMIGQVLKDTITELSLPQTEVKLISKALTTIVNEHLFAKARKLGLNEAVGCLEFAINFPSIVEEVMKRITELPFLFYTHPKCYYEIPQDFIKFEEMLSIPKPSHVPLPPQDVAKLHDYKKKWLENRSCACVKRSERYNEAYVLHVANGLYESEPPPNVDFNFLSLFRREANTQATKEKVIFYKGSVFVRTEEKDMLIVTHEDVHDGTHTVSVEVFTQDREDCLQFNWQGTETVDLESCTATSFPAFSMSARASFAHGVRLNERQFEELISNRSNSDMWWYQ